MFCFNGIFSWCCWNKHFDTIRYNDHSQASRLDDNDVYFMSKFGRIAFHQRQFESAHHIFQRVKRGKVDNSTRQTLIDRKKKNQLFLYHCSVCNWMKIIYHHLTEFFEYCVCVKTMWKRMDGQFIVTANFQGFNQRLMWFTMFVIYSAIRHFCQSKSKLSSLTNHWNTVIIVSSGRFSTCVFFSSSLLSFFKIRISAFTMDVTMEIGARSPRPTLFPSSNSNPISMEVEPDFIKFTITTATFLSFARVIKSIYNESVRITSYLTTKISLNDICNTIDCINVSPANDVNMSKPMATLLPIAIGSRASPTRTPIGRIFQEMLPHYFR